jgi:hypothetical protein
MRAGSLGDPVTGRLQYAQRAGEDPVPPAMHHTGDDLLAGERIKNDDRLAGVVRQPHAIVIDALDGQGQFFGTGFWGHFRWCAAAFSCHGVS